MTPAIKEPLLAKEIDVLKLAAVLGVALLAGCASCPHADHHCKQSDDCKMGADESATTLGNFSVSLTVKDIAVSRAFYEKLGFHVVGGDQSQKWLVMQNGSANIGIFQGMFEKNMLTFNPGWDHHKKQLQSFTDVRELQSDLQGKGLTLTAAADESTSGPAFIMLVDPDGNPILIDQHVDKPAK